jgi:predicted glycoside hydrolase/deacetylase ChbG (UPF0249 family)
MYADGDWVAVYEVVPLLDEAAVFDELVRQRDTFRQLVGREPSHLDSHQHVHRREPLRSLMLKMAEELRVPLRHFTNGIQYCGDFYGQTTEGASLPETIQVEYLIQVFRLLPPGTHELACHPGYAEGLKTMYRGEREIEAHTLCDPRIRAALSEAGIALCSFTDVKQNIFPSDHT